MLNLIDERIGGYPLIIVGLLQVIVVPWIYGSNQNKFIFSIIHLTCFAFYLGTKRLVEDIEKMIGPKPKWFWWIWIISWRFITPIALLAVLILSFIIPPDPLRLRGEDYPDSAQAASWLITATPLAAIPICAAIQIWYYRNDWVTPFFKTQNNI